MVAATYVGRRQCQRRFKHTADLGHSPLPMPSPPERRCLIFAPRLRVVCPRPDSWRAKFESSVLRGIFMDNLQAAMDAPTALNVTVQAIRRREVCRSSRPREGPASWPSAFGRGQIDTKIELGGLFNWKVGRLRGRAGSPWVISCISVADHPYICAARAEARPRRVGGRTARFWKDCRRITSAASSYEIVNSGTFCLKANAKASLGRT